MLPQGATLSVGNATPGRITSVGNANPGTITSVGNANPGTLSLSNQKGASSAPLNTGAGTQSTTGGASTSSSSINNPELLSGLQQEYGSAISTGQALLPFYGQSQNANNAQINTQFGNELNAENNNYTAQNDSYDTQKQANASQQQLSLAELADQIHGQNEGLTNQLGTLGAGSSSAVGMGQNALAKVQNTDRANIQQQAASNNSEISANQQALLAQHNGNLASLNDWKNQQLLQIVNYYTPLIAQTNQAIQEAQGEIKRELAIYAGNLQTQALTDLQNLDSTVRAGVANQTSKLSQQMPSLQTETQQAAPTAVTVPTVSPFSGASTGAANSTAAPTGGSLAALMGNLNQQQ